MFQKLLLCFKSQAKNSLQMDSKIFAVYNILHAFLKADFGPAFCPNTTLTNEMMAHPLT